MLEIPTRQSINSIDRCKSNVTTIFKARLSYYLFIDVFVSQIHDFLR